MKMTASPVGFQRTIGGEAPDLAIDRSVEERFRSSGYLALRDVRCITRDDSLYLHGGLPSYFLKQLAQEIAGEVQGVRKVVNRIEVLRRDGDRATRSMGHRLRGKASIPDTTS